MTGFVAFLGVIFLLNKFQRSREFGTAKQQINKVEKENIDLNFYALLEGKYGYDYEQVVSQRDEATKLVNTFFEGSDWTNQLSG